MEVARSESSELCIEQCQLYGYPFASYNFTGLYYCQHDGWHCQKTTAVISIVTLVITAPPLSFDKPAVAYDFPDMNTPSYITADLASTDELSVCLKYRVDASTFGIKSPLAPFVMPVRQIASVYFQVTQDHCTS